MLNHQLKLAISADFLDAFSKLPKQIQSKTTAFLEKFKKGPTSSGINYESVENAKDSKLKSVRIDLAYRAIILKPEQGNTYTLLWVDKHDDAYDWAKRRVCKINPESGALQIIDVEQVKVIESELTSRNAPETPGRFNHILDSYLLRLGMPEELLGAVRAVVTDEDIDRLIPQLPEEAADAVIMLGAGYSIDEVLDLQDKKHKQIVDPNNLDAALEKDDSKRRFHVITDDADLLEILAAPLEKWRVFLHPSQRRLVERDWKGPVRVLGGAGTGKTVVAMHRAKWLAEHRFTNPSDRILFTTFTRNLAVDIEANLRKICSAETMRRIKVENIDAWVAAFLKSEGITAKIVYDDQLAELWENVYQCKPESPSLPLSFYKDEWREVIQANKVTSLKQYLIIPRTGRGTKLNRVQRAAIWPVFEEYRSLLQQKGWKESEDAMRDVCSLLQSKEGESLPFKAVIVDEAQDMSEAAFCLIRALVTSNNGSNDIFIVGDPHQRIYGRKVVLSRCGIDIRGRSHKLRINYRTTDETRKWATAILTGVSVDDLDGGQDDLKGYRSLLHGSEPSIHGFRSFDEEINFISNYLRGIENGGTVLSNNCIVVRTNHLVKQYSSALNQVGIKTRLIRRSEPDNLSQPGVRIATMHRVKGLQFNYVILAGINEDVLPLKSALGSASDNAARNTVINSERFLLHVAATRAKQEVVVSYYGQSSNFLTAFFTNNSTPTSTELLSIRATDVGEYIRYHSCDRRFKLKLNNYKEAKKLPFFELIFETSLDPVLEAVGRTKELEWEQSLMQSGLVPLTHEDSSSQIHATAWNDFVARLADLSCGKNAYGREIAVNGILGAFHISGQIDFVVLLWDGNQPKLRLVEGKASRKDRTYHRAQLALYWMLVRQLVQLNPVKVGGQLLQVEQIEAVVVRIDELTNQIQDILALEPLDFQTLEADLTRLLDSNGRLNKIIERDLDELDYQLDAKCSDCTLSVHCLAESARQRRLELLGIDPSTIRALKAAGINNIDGLADLDLSGTEAVYIRRDISFTENLELLKIKAGARRRTLPGGDSYINDYEVKELTKYSAHSQQTLLPCRIIDGISLLRVFLSVEYDYAENRIVALCAHVTNSQGVLDTKFEGKNGKRQPAAVVQELVNIEGQKNKYQERELRGEDIIRFQQTAWTGNYQEDTQSEKNLIQEFFTELVKAIASVAGTETAPIHFYVWSKQEMTQLIEGCSRVGSEVLSCLQQLMGLRRDLDNEQLIYTCLDSEVDRCYALGWTGRDLAVVTSLNWYGHKYHWLRIVQGTPVYLDRKEAFFRDIFDFVKYNLHINNQGQWLANPADNSEKQKFEIRLRFFNSLSAAYWRAYWGTLSSTDNLEPNSKLKTAIEDYNNAQKPDYLKEYLRARTHAIRWIEERFPDWLLNPEIEKPSFRIADLSNFDLNVNNIAQAAIDFLRLDHYVNLNDWISAHLVPPLYRVSRGRTLPVRNVQIQSSSFWNRCLTATIYLDNYEINPEVIKANCTIEEGSFVRVTPCFDNPHKGQTIKQLTSGVGFTCAVERIDWGSGLIKLKVIHSKQNRYQLPGSGRKDTGLVFEFATLDESPSDFVAHRVDTKLNTNQNHHVYQWFDPTNPRIPEQVIPPADELNIYQNYLESLRLKRGNGSDEPLHSNQIEAIIKGLLTRIQLLQGPPGTGKTDTTAIATFLRIITRRNTGDIVLVTASTHTAVDTLLLRINKHLSTLREYADRCGLAVPPIILSRVDAKEEEGEKFNNTSIRLFNSHQCANEVNQLRSEGVMVISGTVTGMLKLAESMGNQFQVHTLIVDEASMMAFPHFLSLATLVLVNGEIMLAGDHRQLAPIVAHDWEKEDRPPVVLYQPYVSAYEAVQNLKNNSLTPITDSAILGSALNHTFRLPFIIRHLIAGVYRLDKIELQGVPAPQTNLFAQLTQNPWQTIWNSEQGLFLVVHSESNSRRSNLTEVQIIEQIIAQAEGLSEKSIAIVTPHRAQRTQLKTSLAAYNHLIRVVDTVEKLQGGECHNIFVSATASDSVAIGKNVEFILDLNRSNVAFSRAQKRLIVVCSQTLLDYIPADLEHYKETMLWKDLRSTCSQLIGTKNINSYLAEVFTVAL